MHGDKKLPINKKNQAIAHNGAKGSAAPQSTFQFADHRPESEGHKAIQQKADKSARIQAGAQLQTNANRFVAKENPLIQRVAPIKLIPANNQHVIQGAWVEAGTKVAGFTAAGTVLGGAVGALAGSVVPGAGTAMGAGAGATLGAKIGAGVGAVVGVGASVYGYFYGQTPEQKTASNALILYNQLLVGVNQLVLHEEKDEEKRTSILFQINSRIAKLEKLVQGGPDPNDTLAEMLGWSTTAKRSLDNLVDASKRPPRPKQRHDLIDYKEPLKPAVKAIKEKIVFDDVLLRLAALHAKHKPKAAAPKAAGPAKPYVQKPYAARKSGVIADVQGEFRRWVGDAKSQYNMYHTAETIQGGPYSAAEKQDIMNGIHAALQNWIKDFPFIVSGKVLSGKIGKGNDFNIGCYDAKNKQVINMHFKW